MTGRPGGPGASGPGRVAWRACVLVLVAGLAGGCSAGSGGSGGTDGSTATAGGPGGVGGLATLLPGGAGGAGGSTVPARGVTATAGATGGGSATASPTAGGPTRSVSGAELPFFFEVPSKNIACAMIEANVHCDIGKRAWSPSPAPKDCELDYGNGVYLGSGPAGFTCAGDTLLGNPTALVLPYGQSVSHGDLTCLSQQAGVTCRNTATGRGFTLAREAVTQF